MSDHQFAAELCKRVQRYPELYDISHERFHIEDAKQRAWEAIADELRAQPSKCITKWKTIKHQFVKARKDGNTAWELWSSLKFLDEAANRKTYSLPDDALFVLTKSALESARAGKLLQHLTIVPTPPATETTATSSGAAPSSRSKNEPDVLLMKVQAKHMYEWHNVLRSSPH
ncbi:transcription factor Adf-1 [Rhipicephalus sanguineus]|uniref:transcription factor Adf-1 n=1 Tax=Rhipicephalus sanguineus TaxID=34632 RepID=UPI0020C23FE6|nr:transcription factor Adf-1 [Rhipicephalus sanguineus]